MRRTLSLRRESLAELSSDDLAAVAGGNQYSGDALTCPVLRCLTLGGTCLTCICE